jgi:arylsulfatase
LSLLSELGLEDNTLVFFTSDNGPTFNGGTDSEFFSSAGPLRGLKTQLYEGGIRVPLIARWPGTIPPGSVSDHVSAFWDFVPTLAEVVGTDVPVAVDGLSMLPALSGAPAEQPPHEYLYWEYRGGQAVRMGDWKGYRASIHSSIALYDLGSDVAEEHDLAAQYPGVVERIALFPLVVEE